MRRLVFKAALVLLMAVIWAGSPTPAAARYDQCDEWVDCTGDCCETSWACDILCPTFFAAVCTDTQIFCVSDPE